MQKILHTMLRVGDLPRSIEFYTQVIGMKVLRTLDQPTEKYSLVFLGFGDEAENAVLELTYNYEISNYDPGNAYGHVAISVDDCEKACAEIKAKGERVIQGAKRLNGTNEVIAFVADPDGYQIELIQRIPVKNAG